MKKNVIITTTALILSTPLYAQTSDRPAAAPGSAVQQVTNVRSRLEIYNVTTGKRKVVYEANDHFEAPNWAHDGNNLVFNSHGRLYRFDLTNETVQDINTDPAVNNNNDHGLSPDGKQLVFLSCDASVKGHPQKKTSCYA